MMIALCLQVNPILQHHRLQYRYPLARSPSKQFNFQNGFLFFSRERIYFLSAAFYFLSILVILYSAYCRLLNIRSSPIFTQ